MYWDLNVAWPNNRTQQKRMLEMAITRQRCPHLHLHPITHSTHPHPLTPPSTLPLSLLPAVGYDGIVFTQTLHDKFTNKMVLHPPSPSHARTLSDLPPPTPPLSYPHLPSPPLSPPPSAPCAQRNPMTPVPLSELSLPFPSQSSALRLSTSTSPFPLPPPSPHHTLPSFHQKFRLHLHITDPSHLTPLTHHSAALLTYDLVSATPTSTDLFHACASSDLIDLITLPCTSKLQFHLRRPSLHMARERGIALELTYAGGVREGSLRRYLFACGVAVMRMGGGGKGVVVSSGAEREMEMRDVAGVVSVMRLMGMEGERARDALSTNAEAVLWKGETRKTAKAVLRAVRVTDRTPTQQQHQQPQQPQERGQEDEGDDDEDQRQQAHKRRKTERSPD